MRVSITLRDVPAEAAIHNRGLPFAIFGLLQHEHKVSVLNFTIQRNTEFQEPVRSKVIDLCLSVPLSFDGFAGSTRPVLRSSAAADKSHLQPTHPGWR